MTFAQIEQAFAGGARLISFKTDHDVQQVRYNLYRIARRRGLLWRFATLENEVFVTC